MRAGGRRGARGARGGQRRRRVETVVAGSVECVCGGVLCETEIDVLSRLGAVDGDDGERGVAV